MAFTKLSEFVILIFDFLKSRVASHSCYMIFGIFVGWLISDGITLIDLEPIMATLKNLSAAVFTLAGIWIAYSYPQAISAYTSPSSVKLMPTDETKRIESLVLIVLTSAFVISSLLVFNFVYLIFFKTLLYANHREAFKILGVASISYMAFLQLKAVFTVMVTNIAFVNELHGKRTERIANDDL
ncbi:hypothetical protein [uncultured Marinobacter sp.]|uniref:hypothetical protein n=1 Tax=uncultured Marinobacter sp. TaxID=187379 RepID=UPI00261C124B|nr:hypothetical protein [uncultured Marinobacter sp.]